MQRCWCLLTLFFITDPYEETKTKILAGHRLPCPDPLEYIDGGSSVYDDVMMKCWEADASNRPEFTSISNKLEVLLGEKGVDEYHQQVDQYVKKQMLLHSDKATVSSTTTKLPDPPGDGYIRVESMVREQPPVGAYVQMASLNKEPTGTSGYIGLKDVKHSWQWQWNLIINITKIWDYTDYTKDFSKSA